MSAGRLEVCVADLCGGGARGLLCLAGLVSVGVHAGVLLSPKKQERTVGGRGRGRLPARGGGA